MQFRDPRRTPNEPVVALLATAYFDSPVDTALFKSRSEALAWPLIEIGRSRRFGQPRYGFGPGHVEYTSNWS